MGTNMEVVGLLLISGPTNRTEKLQINLLNGYLNGVCWFCLVKFEDDGGRQVAAT
jgi:hypothetical protein